MGVGGPSQPKRFAETTPGPGAPIFCGLSERSASLLGFGLCRRGSASFGLKAEALWLEQPPRPKRFPLKSRIFIRPSD